MANYFAAVAGNFNAASTWASTAAGAGGAGVPAAGDNAYTNGKAVAITADVTCAKISSEAENGATVGGGYTCSTSGVTINANLVCGATTTSLLVITTSTANATVNINGNVTAGSSYGIYFNPSQVCTLTITGNLLGGTASNYSALFKNASGTINITGTVSARGNVSNACGIDMASTVTGSINITGDVYGGGSGSGSGGGINHIATSHTLSVTGNVYGGYYGAYANGRGILNQNGTVTITGNVYGSSYNVTTCPGVHNLTTGMVTVVGKAVAGNYSYGIQNDSTGTVKVTRAVGNSYGVGSTGMASVPGVYSGAQNSLTYVEEIEYGALGQTPTGGPIILTSKTSNVALFYTGTTQRMLTDAQNVSGALPAASDVRYGTTYNFGGNTGTCRIPPAASVAVGVLVDNTVGTAALTPAAFWSALTSSMTTSGSIGERLANASTVSSVGQQLSNALSN